MKASPGLDKLNGKPHHHNNSLEAKELHIIGGR